NVAQALGRPLRLEPQAEDAPLNNYANERLTQLNQQQRCDAFIQFASDVMLTRCELTSEAKAAEAAIRLCKELGDQSVVISGDTRLEELGISERLQQECNAVVWDPAKGAENISHSLFILRKSTILPRVAQLAEKLHQKAQAGERMPSCINIISGPSSTADIELIKVVGVHGPVKAVYLIIEDC
ncbi:MAG: lactate utilization protein C, partial [Escherichia coli]|nr:lactate utilization protein C [Escherichia coli]